MFFVRVFQMKKYCSCISALNLYSLSMFCIFVNFFLSSPNVIEHLCHLNYIISVEIKIEFLQNFDYFRVFWLPYLNWKLIIRMIKTEERLCKFEWFQRRSNAYWVFRHSLSKVHIWIVLSSLFAYYFGCKWTFLDNNLWIFQILNKN